VQVGHGEGQRRRAVPNPQKTPNTRHVSWELSTTVPLCATDRTCAQLFRGHPFYDSTTAPSQHEILDPVNRPERLDLKRTSIVSKGGRRFEMKLRQVILENGGKPTGGFEPNMSKSGFKKSSHASQGRCYSCQRRGKQYREL